MLFHVRRYEDHYDIQFSLLDWDKVSGNDFIGTSQIPLQELIGDAPGPDPKTGLYGPREDGKHDMKEFAVSGNPEPAGDFVLMSAYTLALPNLSYRSQQQRSWAGKADMHQC